MMLDAAACLHISSPVIGLGINVIAQVCVLRCIAGFRLLESIFLGFILGACTSLSIELYHLRWTSFSLSQNISSLIINAVTYAALGYSYFHFINMGETARRVRIVRELYDSGGGLSIEGLLKRYNAKEIIEKRIGRLAKNGQIVCRNGRYYVGRHVMLLAARVIVAMKLILLGRKSEFAE